MTEMIVGRSTIHECKCENATPCENDCTCKHKGLSPVSQLSKSYRGCRYYRPIKGTSPSAHPCIINDLCDQRQITDCPVRVAWCQNIGESDDDFASFLYDVGTNPSDNLTKYINSRGC